LTIRDSESFYFNGHYSSEYNLINVSVDSGLYEEPFISKVNINRQKIRGRDKPYFLSKEYEPLEFKVSFAFTETWDDDLINEILIWLSPAYYEELYFSANPELIYYAMPVDDSNLIHNGLKQGYITLTFQNIDCYKRSAAYSTTVSSTTEVTTSITNLGTVSIYPKIEIEKLTSTGDVSIFNLSNGNAELKFEDLTAGETVTVYCEEKDIVTSLANTYRYDKHNGYWLELLTGANNLKVTGLCNVTFTYEFKYR